MSKSFFVVLALLTTPFVSFANYYVSDYDPDYVPYNLQEAIDSMDYDSCVTDLRDFDATYESYLDLYGTPFSVGETLDVNFGALKETYEEEFRQCLILVRGEIQEESVENCDFEVIEALNTQEERLYREEIRTCENLRAIEECDFSYIDEMDGMEKFEYRSEIDVCEASIAPEVTEEPPVTVQELPQPPTQQTEIVPEPIRAPIPEPVYTPPPPTITTPELVIEAVSESQSEHKTNDVASTSDEETFVMTQDEIDALVAERVAEASQTEDNTQSEEPTPEEKPGFFSRVWNFFFGWLK